MLVILLGKKKKQTKKKLLQKYYSSKNIIALVGDLTHCSLDTPKRLIGKQCRPRSDAAEQMLQNRPSDQGLHCLQVVQPFYHLSKSHSSHT